MSEVTVATVGKPHGLDGSVHVYTAVWDAIAEGSTVTVNGVEAEVVRRAGTPKRPILRLSCCSDRSQAELLRGKELTAEVEQLPELGDSEWYTHDLEGCLVRGDGRSLGRVVRVLGYPSCDLLEVVDGSAGSKPLLVPLLNDALIEVDVEQKLIEVDLEFLNLDDAG